MPEESIPSAKPKGFITAKEAEQRYGLSGSYLIRMHKAGKFAGELLGPVWFLHEESLDAWYKTRKKRGGWQPRKTQQPQPEPDPGPDMPLLALGASV